MKLIYRFDQYAPPALSERTLRERLELRRLKRQTILLAAAAVLLQILLAAAGLLLLEVHPVLSVSCFAYVLLSVAGGGAAALICSKKGGYFS